LKIINLIKYFISIIRLFTLIFKQIIETKYFRRILIIETILNQQYIRKRITTRTKTEMQTIRIICQVVFEIFHVKNTIVRNFIKISIKTCNDSE
jgi:hypothetical protein